MNKLFAGLCFAALVGCLPSADYAGPHTMNWTLTLDFEEPAHSVVKGGTTHVEIHEGPGNELLVDLGPGLCHLSATYVEAFRYSDKPYFDIAPQHCWLDDGQGGFDLTVGGSGSYLDKHEDHLAIALTGSFAAGTQHGGLDWQLSEAW